MTSRKTVSVSPLTSDDGQAGVLRPRHHRGQLGRTQNQHVQEAAVRRHHQHGSLLQVCLLTFDLHPKEPQGGKDGSTQQPDDGVQEPAAPAGHRLRALLRRQASQSEAGQRPHDQEEESSEGHAKGEEDAAEEDALRIR